MFKKLIYSVGRFVCKIGNLFIRLSENDGNNLKSKIQETGVERNLYKTQFNDFFWLNQEGYIDQCLVQTGMFEETSTQIVKDIVNKGDYILDVGANIGYYSVLFAKLAGNTGKVFCIEPTAYYRDVLKLNLQANAIENAKVFDVGLSNQCRQEYIQIGDSSATLHSPITSLHFSEELINLTTLDEFILQNQITKIDLIKIDIDGHEPHFFEGATEFFRKNKPILLIEFANLNLFVAGTDVLKLKEKLENLGYILYSEKTRKQIVGITDFLIECGNYNISANVWAIPSIIAQNLVSLNDL